MIPDQLSQEERSILLELARQELNRAVLREPRSSTNLSSLPPRLQELGATFVTLTINGELRGCIGALEAYQPLAEDVKEHAMAAALQDYRFPPVKPDELQNINIEISRLTPAKPFDYQTSNDLLKGLRPGVDGVVLRYGGRRATFLPQVWEKIPDPSTFLSHLCQKMGAAPDLWLHKKLDVLIYQVEEFHE